MIDDLDSWENTALHGVFQMTLRSSFSTSQMGLEYGRGGHDDCTGSGEQSIYSVVHLHAPAGTQSRGELIKSKHGVLTLARPLDDNTAVISFAMITCT